MFDDALFPVELAALHSGASWTTVVTTLKNGAEQRIQLWNDARRRYDAGLGISTLAQLQTTHKHFNGRRGRTRSFPLTDRSLDRVSNEQFGTGDGATAAFQLLLNEGDASNAYNREIYLPKTGTLIVKVATVTKTEGVHYNVNYATGVVTFTGGNIPSGGQAITWTGEFFVPVRYDIDEFPSFELFVFNSDGTGLVNGPSIPMIEVRDLS